MKTKKIDKLRLYSFICRREKNWHPMEFVDYSVATSTPSAEKFRKRHHAMQGTEPTVDAKGDFS